MKHHLLTILAATLTFGFDLRAEPVSTVEALAAAVAEAKSGTVIELAAGTYRLTQPLDLKGGVTLRGAGVGKTIVTSAESWSANPATLPDPETNHKDFDRTGYLIRCVKSLASFQIESSPWITAIKTGASSASLKPIAPRCLSRGRGSIRVRSPGNLQPTLRPGLNESTPLASETSACVCSL